LHFPQVVTPFAKAGDRLTRAAIRVTGMAQVHYDDQWLRLEPSPHLGVASPSVVITIAHLGSWAAIQEEEAARGAQEQYLNHGFRSGAITAEQVSSMTERISDLEGQLRHVHLQAPVVLADILTESQVATYDAFRGYGVGACDVAHRALGFGRFGGVGDDRDMHALLARIW
jgi:hypothetical protein